ncbi:MAG: alpha/beta fold hydrolase [Solirubrobacteraceae bacterium]
MPYFRRDGNRIAYTEHGRGSRVVVLVPGLLFSQRMQEPLARSLAARGNRVVTLDPLGHGASDRPAETWRYSMAEYGREVVALLDHLDVPEAVIGGASLGANTTLEVASIAPERVRGMVIEMPVLEAALLGCAIAFTPLMCALTFGAPAMRGLAAVARRAPRSGVPYLGGLLLDWVSQDPAPSAAVLKGLFFGRVAPHRDERREFHAPALIIGHRRDPVHPFSDAGLLADELPDARMLDADSILELRTRPERLTGEIADFVDHCWRPRQRRRAERRSADRRQGASRRGDAKPRAAKPRAATRRAASA